MLQLLDILFTVLHILIIGFNVFGWIWEKTRKAHLIVISLTLLAWLVIGWWVGTIGYCPLTDWHWDIKRELGQSQLPNSFVKYAVDKIFNTHSNTLFIDVITAAGLIFGVVMTVIKNRLIPRFLRKKT